MRQNCLNKTMCCCQLLSLVIYEGLTGIICLCLTREHLKSNEKFLV